MTRKLPSGFQVQLASGGPDSPFKYYAQIRGRDDLGLLISHCVGANDDPFLAAEEAVRKFYVEWDVSDHVLPYEDLREISLQFER